MMSRWVVVFLLLLVTSCAPDPRNQADADAVTRASQQAARDAEQNRAQSQTIFERGQALWESVKAPLIWAANFLIKWGGITVAVTLCYVMISTGRAISTAAEGVGEAVKIYAITRAELAANTIHMDENTRTFPMFRQALPEPISTGSFDLSKPYMVGLGNRRYVLVNPAIDSIQPLDLAHEADRQLIANMGLVQMVGAWAREARRAGDGEISAGVAAIQPVIVSANDQKNNLHVGQFVDVLREMMSAEKSEEK
jgi:hypothetical protein